MPILSIVLALISLLIYNFSGSLVTTSTKESGYVIGAGSFSNKIGSSTYNADKLLWDKGEILFIICVILLVISLIIFLSKKQNLVYFILNIIVSLAAFIVPIVSLFTLSDGLDYGSSSIASYSKYRFARLTSGGWFTVIIAVVSIACSIYLMYKYLKAMTEFSPTENGKKTNISADEFSA